MKNCCVYSCKGSVIVEIYVKFYIICKIKINKLDFFEILKNYLIEKIIEECEILLNGIVEYLRVFEDVWKKIFYVK